MSGPAGGASFHDREIQPDAARRAPACALVIFGASGDLTERKLLPAIRQLAAHHRLRPEFALVGVARTAMSDEEWADKCLSDHPGGKDATAEWAPKASFRYVSGGYDDPETYRCLGDVLAECDRTLGTAGHHVFYLAMPPRLFGIIAVQLGASGLNVSTEGDWPRLVIEKPFGWDEASARSLYADISASFKDRGSSASITIWQGHRSEPAGPALRQLDLRADLEPELGRQRADHGGRDDRARAGLYDVTGAVRDIVQNHVRRCCRCS
jgi:glucose-6-phosphate 1-dehydrogenase